MLLKVGQDDFIGYRNNNEWLKKHPCSAIIFHAPEKIWPSVRSSYRTSFKHMVFGQLPDETDLLATLDKIKSRIQPIAWEIDH
ncbi:hypothetical protein [Desulfocicer vacuolatum]|uniref:hypothetical protein n=1 Tax=Desulfocicer vacuolatum TaxID=2298 RepID=UPI0009FCC64F|nr:hypothetical protein [Desulfocicer vacuolatum]